MPPLTPDEMIKGTFMKTLDNSDPLPLPGERIIPVAPPPPKETRSPTNPQVIIRPDGKMETAIPENAKARWEALAASLIRTYFKGF